MFNLIPLELLLEEFFSIPIERAVNGKEAVELFEANLMKTCCQKYFKLVLMDLNMPIMDGYEATLHILDLMA
jgi:CheY-like chemotaxis protein